MRTTLTLDPDVAERLRQETASGGASMKQVVNERLRIGFGIRPERKRPRFQVVPHRSSYRPGVDPMKLNQLADELEVEAARASAAGATK